MCYLHTTIKKSGGRLTKIKQAIINILISKGCLLDKTSINTELSKIKLFPNRSTLYRELQFLVNNDIIIKNTINGMDYFEIPQDHHHHLVCLGCNLINKVDIGNHLKEPEKRITKNTGFEIKNHTLEFYGYCKNCVKISTSK